MESSDFGSAARRIFDTLDRAVYLGAKHYDALIGVEMDPASPGSILSMRILASHHADYGGAAADSEELDYRRYQLVATITAEPGHEVPVALHLRLVSADSVAQVRYVLSPPLTYPESSRGRRRLMPSRLTISCALGGTV
jgi:hypothetical protein